MCFTVNVVITNAVATDYSIARNYLKGEIEK